MGGCSGKLDTEDKPGRKETKSGNGNSKAEAAAAFSEKLFEDEDEDARPMQNSALTQGKGNGPGPPGMVKKSGSTKGLPLFSPFHERKNMVWESPAMSVMGTPAVHLPNYSPAPANFAGIAASILGNAEKASKPSRLRGEEKRPPSPGGRDGGGGGGTGPEAGSKSTAGQPGQPGQLEKNFGFQRNIGGKYELEQEIGRGHFGHTCFARCKKGEMKGKECAVKILPKSNMTTPLAVEDVKREVKILKSLGGRGSVVKFLDAFEDQLNVYICTELCDGGELLEHILQRGGRYPEREAKDVMQQILSILAYCHQQGVVHRDLKPENFLLKNKDDGAPLRIIDFGLSDFVAPDQRMNDIVGSAYYIAPEVLHRMYGTEADIWSAGVIAYILLSGARPFWARTESGIFRAVLRMEPNFHDMPWPQVSSSGKEFVKWLLTKDFRRRPTAAQALTHPWLRGAKVPLDTSVIRNLRSFFGFSKLRKAGLRALVSTLTEDELIYLRAQYAHFDTNEDGLISFDDLKIAMNKVASEAMKSSKQMELLKNIDAGKMKKMSFDEFCAGAMNVFQLEALPNWPERARVGYRTFIESGHGHITIDELAKEMGQLEVAANAMVLEEWTNFDGTVSFLGFTRLVHGPSRARNKARIAPKKASPTNSGRSAGLPKGEMNSIPEDKGAQMENFVQMSPEVGKNVETNKLQEEEGRVDGGELPRLVGASSGEESEGSKSGGEGGKRSSSGGISLGNLFHKRASSVSKSGSKDSSVGLEDDLSIVT